MPEPTPEETLRALGHREGGVYQKSTGRWRAYCGCGWVSRTSVSQKEAAGMLVHHLRAAMKEHRESGLPLPTRRKKLKLPQHIVLLSQQSPDTEGPHSPGGADA